MGNGKRLNHNSWMNSHRMFKVCGGVNHITHQSSMTTIQGQLTMSVAGSAYTVWDWVEEIEMCVQATVTSLYTGASRQHWLVSWQKKITVSSSDLCFSIGRHGCRCPRNVKSFACATLTSGREASLLSVIYCCPALKIWKDLDLPMLDWLQNFLSYEHCSAGTFYCFWPIYGTGTISNVIRPIYRMFYHK